MEFLFNAFLLYLFETEDHVFSSLLALKPHWGSGSRFSATPDSLLSRTQANTFLEMDSREMQRWCPHALQQQGMWTCDFLKIVIGLINLLCMKVNCSSFERILLVSKHGTTLYVDSSQKKRALYLTLLSYFDKTVFRYLCVSKSL